MDARVKPAHDDLFLLPLHRLRADVAAAKAFRPADAIDRFVGAALRVCQGLAPRANIQHAAAIGENLSILRHRAGMKYLDTFDLRGLIEAFDHRALAVSAGIAF